MVELTFNDDRSHNLIVLNALIKQASPPSLQDYWREGYVDDDFKGYTDYKVAIAYVLSRLLATDPMPRVVQRAMFTALAKLDRAALVRTHKT